MNWTEGETMSLKLSHPNGASCGIYEDDGRYVWNVECADGTGATGMTPTLDEAKRLAIAFAETAALQP